MTLRHQSPPGSAQSGQLLKRQAGDVRSSRLLPIHCAHFPRRTTRSATHSLDTLSCTAACQEIEAALDPEKLRSDPAPGGDLRAFDIPIEPRIQSVTPDRLALSKENAGLPD